MNEPNLRTCVSPSGTFLYGLHEPAYQVRNLRENAPVECLGVLPDGDECRNTANFPQADVQIDRSDAVFEIPNAFPFKGVTYILRRWADEKARDPSAIRLPAPPDVSLSNAVRTWLSDQGVQSPDLADFLANLPEPVQLALGTASTDPDELVCLAELSCRFVHDPKTGRPAGLAYARDDRNRPVRRITRHALFEAAANNPFLPDDYKAAMVLTPGAQGDSEITGEWRSPDGRGHVWEYLRKNSYIPWGHYAANMADDSVRYAIGDLTMDDVAGMRHLYYQRTFVRMAEDVGLDPACGGKALDPDALERLRERIMNRLSDDTVRADLTFTSTLWGWNFGFDYSPTHYRLHASHQQIHQQYALIPKAAPRPAGFDDAPPAAYACGDLIADFSRDYRTRTGRDFFETYISAIKTNRRMDGDPEKEASLIVHADDHVMLFVPKAQTSQWELQLMTLRPAGHILEADAAMRRALDRGILTAVRALAGLGARMITCIEYSKRFDAADADQRLLYAFLPRLPESPGAFSEAQLRWINGHYPEDFAVACRNALLKR